MRTVKLVLAGLGTVIAAHLVAMATFRALESIGINDQPDEDGMWIYRAKLTGAW